MKTFVFAAAVLALGCRSSGGSTSTNGAPAPAATAADQNAAKNTTGNATTSSVAADYYPYSKPGTGVIDGQAFVVIQGGDVLLDSRGYLTTLSDNVRTASGNEVTLDPATPYAMAWYMKAGTSLRRFANSPNDAAFRSARSFRTRSPL